MALCLRAHLEEWSSGGEHTVGGVWLPPILPSGHCSSHSSRAGVVHCGGLSLTSPHPPCTYIHKCV